MNTPTPTSTPPGDREAAQNATRRAERRGTADPQVDVAAVRLALADARDMAHLKQLLEAEGVEAEFDRRGQARAVYGWRLRRQGSEEWLKASTLARDLSWPKIAHRFAESNSAKELPTQKSTSAAQADEPLEPPDHKTRDPYARAPAMIRQSLGEMAGKKSLLNFDLVETRKNIWGDEVLAAPAKILLDIGFTAMKLGAEALKALMRFIQWLLTKFGFGAAPAPAGTAQAKTSLPFLPVIDVESRFLPEPDALKLRADQAAAELQQVASALEKNDVDLLPAGEGRAELAAALTAERTPFSTPSKEDKTVYIPANAENQQQPEEPKQSALQAFQSAAKAQQAAWAAVGQADKVDAPEVEIARKKFASALRRLQLARAEYAAQKEKKPALLRFAFPAENTALAEEFAAHAAAKAGLEEALRDHPPAAPEALRQAYGRACVTAMKAADAALAEAQVNAANLQDGEVKNFAVQRAAKLAVLVKHISYGALPGQVQEAVLLVSDTPRLIAAKVEELEKKRIFEVQKLLQNNVSRNSDDDGDVVELEVPK